MDNVKAGGDVNKSEKIHFVGGATVYHAVIVGDIAIKNLVVLPAEPQV